MEAGGRALRREQADGNAGPTAAALSNVTAVRLRRLQALFARHWALHFRGSEIELSAVQAGLLLLIRENPGQPQAAFARLLAVEPPSLAQTLAPLVETGLVERRRAKRDARAMALHLSQKGADVARAVEAGQPKHEARLLAGLGAEERRALLALLDKAVASAERAVAAAETKLEGSLHEHA